MKFVIIFLIIVQVSDGHRSTTPAWKNIELMMNYLKAYPSLRNLSSKELGLPDGVDFTHVIYRVRTTPRLANSTIALPSPSTLRSDKLETTATISREYIQASTHMSSSYDKSFTTASPQWTTIATTDLSNGSTGPTLLDGFPSTSSAAATRTAETDHQQIKSRGLSCLRCIKSNTSAPNCTRKDCVTGQCILGYIAQSLSPMVQHAVVRMCSTDRIVFSKQKNSTAVQFSLIPSDEFYHGANFSNAECRNDSHDQLTINQFGIQYSINENVLGEYRVRYVCCNTSFCNNFDNFNQKDLMEIFNNSIEKHGASDEVTIETSSTRNPLSTSATGQNTTLDYHDHVSSHSVAYTDVTVEMSSVQPYDKSFDTSQQNVMLSSAQPDAHGEASGYVEDSGSSSGQPDLYGTTDSSRQTAVITSTTIYYTESAPQNRQYNISTSPIFNLDTPTYASGSGFSDNAINTVAFTASSAQEVFPEYTKPSTSGDGSDISWNPYSTTTNFELPQPTSIFATTDRMKTTNRMTATQTNGISTNPSSTHYEGYTTNLATNATSYQSSTSGNLAMNSDIMDIDHSATQTPGGEKTRRISKSYEIQSLNPNYQGISTRHSYDRNRSAHASTFRSATSATTAGNYNDTATSTPKYRDLSDDNYNDTATSKPEYGDHSSSVYTDTHDRSKPDYVKFTATSTQYLSRLFLLLNDTVDITSISFLTKLERNLGFAYARASRVSSLRNSGSTNQKLSKYVERLLTTK